MAIIYFFKILPVTGNEAWFAIRVKLNLNFIIHNWPNAVDHTPRNYFIRKGPTTNFSPQHAIDMEYIMIRQSDRIWERGGGTRPRAELGKGENRPQAELKDVVGMRITTYIYKFKSNADWAIKQWVSTSGCLSPIKLALHLKLLYQPKGNFKKVGWHFFFILHNCWRI